MLRHAARTTCYKSLCFACNTVPVTLELFNHKRQSRELAAHSVGVVTQITATMRVNSGWSGQYGLLDYSCKPSPFKAGLLTLTGITCQVVITISQDIVNKIQKIKLYTLCASASLRAKNSFLPQR